MPFIGTADKEFFEFLVTLPPPGRLLGGGCIHRDVWREVAITALCMLTSQQIRQPPSTTALALLLVFAPVAGSVKRVPG